MSLTPLTDEQFAHIQEAWRLFDTDSDGLVTPKDLQTLLRSFGYEHSLVPAHPSHPGPTDACARMRSSVPLATAHRLASRCPHARRLKLFADFVQA